MKIKPLIEEFVGYVQGVYSKKDDLTSVFCFPLNSKEMKELRKDGDTVRFIADPKNKKVYIFNAKKAIHYNVFGEYGIPSPANSFHGVASFNNNKIVFERSDYYNVFISLLNLTPHNREILKSNWSFADKYIKGISDYIKKILKK
jgi:hypothetical protein